MAMAENTTLLFLSLTWNSCELSPLVAMVQRNTTLKELYVMDELAPSCPDLTRALRGNITLNVQDFGLDALQVRHKKCQLLNWALCNQSKKLSAFRKNLLLCSLGFCNKKNA